MDMAIIDLFDMPTAPPRVLIELSFKEEIGENAALFRGVA
jgi:hypothetical protein